MADSSGMPSIENSGAMTTWSTSTINHAPTRPATMAPMIPPGMPRPTRRSPISPAMAPTRRSTSRCISVISSLQISFSSAIKKYRHPQAICQACRVDQRGERLGLQFEQATRASGTRKGAGARRRAQALLAEPWVLDLPRRPASDQLRPDIRLYERAITDHGALHHLHPAGECRQRQGHHRAVQLHPGGLQEISDVRVSQRHALPDGAAGVRDRQPRSLARAAQCADQREAPRLGGIPTAEPTAQLRAGLVADWWLSLFEPAD